MALQEADFDHRSFMGQGGQSPDDKLFVKFFMDAVQDQDATKREGRPMFKEVEFILIQAPGNLLTNINRPVRFEDKQRFPRQYMAWKAGQDQESAMAGTPLAQWPLVNKAQVEELKYFKIYTVEQLASVSDVDMQKFMGIVDLKRKAKDWLGKAENNKEFNALREENTDMKLEIEELRSALKELSAQVKAQKGK
jgi:hypothetical protein